MTANRKVSAALTATGRSEPGQRRLASAEPMSTTAAEITMQTKPERTPGAFDPPAAARASTTANGAAPTKPRTAPTMRIPADKA